MKPTHSDLRVSLNSRKQFLSWIWTAGMIWLYFIWMTSFCEEQVDKDVWLVWIPFDIPCLYGPNWLKSAYYLLILTKQPIFINVFDQSRKEHQNRFKKSKVSYSFISFNFKKSFKFNIYILTTKYFYFSKPRCSKRKDIW